MPTKEKGLEFDPGFAPHLLVFQGTVQYLYTDINRLKNLSQRKVKFMQYYKKLLQVFYNNLGFYTGCLMWASYIKTQPEQEILSNHCFGKPYDEEENTAETDYMIQFTALFPKDMKYFLGQNFSFDENTIKLLNLYRKFLVINKGFVNSKLNTDILLPEGIKPYKDDFKTYIDNAISKGDLNKLTEYISELV